MDTTMLTRRRLLLAALAGAALGGCGFRLRGSRALPFASVFITGNIDAEMLRLVQRRITAAGTTQIVDSREQAEVVLEFLGANREKAIIGLSGAGKVREYEFRQSVRFTLLGARGRELIAPITLSAVREATWDDAAILAKEQEEALLYQDMQGELARQLLRRLEAVKPAR